MDRYFISHTGFIVAYGAIDSGVLPAGTEPFNKSNFEEWRKDMTTGQWVNTVVNYQYIIVPTDLIPAITGMAALVKDILPHLSFTVYLGTQQLTNRDGEPRSLNTLPVDFTPCSIEAWEPGDDALLQSIVDQFNLTYDPPRRIEFPCKFNSLAELEAFKALQI